MALTPASSAGAVVIDANVLIAISSKEAVRDAQATAELGRYASQGYGWFTPGVALGETLYVLCGKLAAGILSTAEYAAAPRRPFS